MMNDKGKNEDNGSPSNIDNPEINNKPQVPSTRYDLPSSQNFLPPATTTTVPPPSSLHPNQNPSLNNFKYPYTLLQSKIIYPFPPPLPSLSLNQPSIPGQILFNQQYDQLLSQPIRVQPVNEIKQSPSPSMPIMKEDFPTHKESKSPNTSGEANANYPSVLNPVKPSYVKSSSMSSFKADPTKKSHVHNQYSDFSKVIEDDLSKQGHTRPYKCNFPKCDWAFVRESDYRRHLKCHEAPSYQCPYWKLDPSCHKKGGSFTRLDVLKRHLRLIHYVRAQKPSKNSATSKDDPGWCITCQATFLNSKQFLQHTNECSEKMFAKRNREKLADDLLTDPNNNLMTLSSVVNGLNDKDKLKQEKNAEENDKIEEKVEKKTAEKAEENAEEKAEEKAEENSEEKVKEEGDSQAEDQEEDKEKTKRRKLNKRVIS